MIIVEVVVIGAAWWFFGFWAAVFAFGALGITSLILTSR